MKISMILYLASLLLDINPVIGQQQIVRIDSKIDRVTVYPGFALVERIALIPEQEVGSEFTLAIGPLPSSAQPSSFQTQVVGDAIAVQGLELKSRLSAVVSNKDEEGLLKDKDDLMLQLLDLKAKKAGIELQIVSLNKMSSMVFAESGVSSTTFENASEHLKFLRSQRTIYETNMQHCERDMAKVVAKVDDIDTQLNGVRSKAKSKVREARLSCFAQRKAPSQVRLTYLVAGASWHPAYDVHVSTDMTGVSVNAIGQVSQRTGEDWSGVNLVLSTSMPQIGLDPPQVPSLSVSAIDMSRQQGDSSWASDDVIGANAELKFGGRSKRGRPAPPSASASPATPGAPPREEAPTVQAVDYGITTQFVMPGLVDVAKNGEAHRFAIRTVPLEISPQRYIVPSQSDKAFLRADVTHTGDSVLLAGTAKIFIGPDYLGESSFPLLRKSDKTTLNLGIDPNIEVEYETIEDFRDDPGSFSLSSTSTITRRYRANLRLSPAAQGPVNLRIEEALPVSNTNKVAVSFTELSPDPLDDEEAMTAREEQGLYKWNLVLAPGQRAQVSFGYELSFDEDLSPSISEVW